MYDIFTLYWKLLRMNCSFPSKNVALMISG